MSTRNEITCNFCGAIKKQVNHWYSLSMDPPVKLIIVKGQSGLTPFDACGERCVHEAVSRFLSVGRLED